MPPKARAVPSTASSKPSGPTPTTQPSAPSRSAHSLAAGSAGVASTVASSAKANPERTKSRYAILDDFSDLFTPDDAPAPQAAPVMAVQPAASGSHSGVTDVSHGEVSTIPILFSVIKHSKYHRHTKTSRCSIMKGLCPPYILCRLPHLAGVAWNSLTCLKMMLRITWTPLRALRKVRRQQYHSYVFYSDFTYVLIQTTISNRSVVCLSGERHQ